MFDNTLAYKRMLKKQHYQDEIKKAQEDGKDWKVKQLESKLKMFERKYYPDIYYPNIFDTIKKKERGAKNE